MDPEWWTNDKFHLGDSRPPIRVTVTTGGDPPDARYVQAVTQRLTRIDALVLAAAPLILRNYDRAYFANIGVPKSRLVDETPAAIATAATLESAWLSDSEAQSFELSFSVPWDDNHSFDVEFENGEPTRCSVNG